MLDNKLCQNKEALKREKNSFPKSINNTSFSPPKSYTNVQWSLQL